jgi:hypothetical protein
MSSRPDKIEQLGQLHDKVIVIHPVEGVRFEEILVERGFEGESSDFLDPTSALHV